MPHIVKIHAVADKMEVRVARALDGAFTRMRSRVPIAQIEAALERGDARMAGELIDRTNFADALEPTAEILKDTFVRGGKVGAEEVQGG